MSGSVNKVILVGNLGRDPEVRRLNSGQLQTRKWTDASGAEKYTTEVVLQRFRGELTLLDGRASGGGGDSFGGGEERSSGGSSFGRSSPVDRKPALASGGGGGGDIDDDIPF
jgi:single-strand DNA-binding protein